MDSGVVLSREQWEIHKRDGYPNGFSNYEHQYMDALRKIFTEGYSDGVNERTGHSTLRLPGVVFQIDVEKEFPILKSKLVYWKSAVDEILWIMQRQSNSIHDLKPHIWDSWADSDGRINSCYGYQVDRPVIAKLDGKREYFETQVHFVLDYLKDNPNGRWGIITLWNPTELYKMNLCPCCHTSTWNLDGGRLNCVLDQRSGDMPVGVPFNTTQYAALMHMFARHLDVKPGVLTHVIADAHIYDNQIDLVEKQIMDFDALKMGWSLHNGDMVDPALSTKEYEHEKDGYIDGDKVRFSRPKFEINPEVTDFWKISTSDCVLSDYVSNSKIPYPVVQ